VIFITLLEIGKEITLEYSLYETINTDYPHNSEELKLENARVSKYSEFSSILDAVIRKSPFQKKKITGLLADMDESYFEQAESFAAILMKYLDSNNIDVDYIAGAYLKMCADVMIEQKKFMQSGVYSCESFPEAMKNIYGNEDAMKAYMHGLLLSQFLWKNHYMIYDFFLKEGLAAGDIGRYLEIGPGHGLFLSQAAKLFPKASFLAIDVSRASIDMSKKIVKIFSGRDDIVFECGDIQKHAVPGKYDFIGMCEVIEHVEDPRMLLSAAKNLLSQDGRLFITTCANCPAVDHLYNFANVEAIEKMISGSGLSIIKAIALPVENIPRDRWTETCAAVNYAAILEAAGQY
jgi:SAM-dependent methyltransferase